MCFSSPEPPKVAKAPAPPPTDAQTQKMARANVEADERNRVQTPQGTVLTSPLGDTGFGENVKTAGLGSTSRIAQTGTNLTVT